MITRDAAREIATLAINAYLYFESETDTEHAQESAIDSLLTDDFWGNQPTIVCLCGSTRFWRTFQEAGLRETMAGRIVLSIGAASGTDDEHFGNLPREEYDRVKTMLDELHLRKIDLADEARSEALARAETGETITHQAARQIVEQHKPAIEPLLPPDFDDVQARLAARGVTLTSEIRGDQRWYVTYRTGKTTGIATPTWSNVVDSLEYHERKEAEDAAASPEAAISRPDGTPAAFVLKPAVCRRCDIEWLLIEADHYAPDRLEDMADQLSDAEYEALAAYRRDRSTT